MPLDSQLIAGALAHGLSPGAIATWDPGSRGRRG